MSKVGIIMGSDTDLPIMAEAEAILQEMGIQTELTIVSAHRTPDRLVEYAKSAISKGLNVIVAGAGGAAHLPGMVASLTSLPVVGVPIRTQALQGLDSLLSIVQMPGGIPVATVAINGGKNAGLLAARILGATDQAIRARLEAWTAAQKTEVELKAQKLEQLGALDYLAGKS